MTLALTLSLAFSILVLTWCSRLSIALDRVNASLWIVRNLYWRNAKAELLADEAARCAELARLREREAFHSKWGTFFKCTGCGARTTWCDACDQTMRPTIVKVGYTAPPSEAWHPVTQPRVRP